ncbi:ABC transporter ATP-binding protein [Bauldia sp.]|uniref:ABC transporter ATP-binding protein n=1 Tax=Bauldia sp. TaxID=2575872 RepID=UPI003BAD7AF7
MRDGNVGDGLAVTNLQVEFYTDDGIVKAVDGVDFAIKPGVRTGIVGESGSGKTTTALALMGMIEPPGRVVDGRAELVGLDLLGLTEEQFRQHRLATVSYIPQGAMNSLNPVARIGTQILDGMTDHGLRLGNDKARDRVAELLARVDLSPDVARMYPHELSGGMKQRACIAISIALRPALLIADEPTSALDVITQRRVMETLRKVQEDIGSSLILIGHDMGLMAQFVDDIVVMRHGKIVEHGSVRDIFACPTHDYTRQLIDSVPSLERKAPAATVSGQVPLRETPLLEFDGAGKTYVKGRSRVEALKPLSFRLEGSVPRVIAVVGQSGSGKTTMGLLALGFEAATQGAVRFDGADISKMNDSQVSQLGRDVQAVFQDPYASYNPFYKVDHVLTVPLRNFGIVSDRSEALDHIVTACRSVGLDPGQTIHRYAHQMSGGQRQRLMVGRAIMLKPRLLVADEPVSMVDASLRSTILGNLAAMKADLGISILYITHDLATAYEVADYVLVLHKGRLVEAGVPETVIDDPLHPYTRLLVDSIPWPDPDRHWGAGGTLDEELSAVASADLSAPAIIREQVAGFRIDTAGHET